MFRLASRLQTWRACGGGLCSKHGIACSLPEGMSSPVERGPLRQDFYKHGLVSLSTGLTTMEAAIEGLSNFRKVTFESSNFVKPVSVLFHDNGRERKWDLIEAHDSVAVLLYHIDLNAILIVRQFRPAVYATQLRRAKAAGLPDPPFSVGFTYECCAGLVDKDKSLSEIACEEILEECGYDIAPENLAKVTEFTASVGVAGCKQTLFFGKVTEAQHCNSGGGVAAAGEMIELLALPVDECESFLSDTSLPKSTGLMFACKWLLNEFKRSSTIDGAVRSQQ